MSARTIIKKGKEDTSATVMVIIASILILISIFISYFSIEEYNKNTDALEQTKKKARTRQQELEDNIKKAVNLSNRIGWLSRDEMKISTGNIWNNYDSLKGFLNRMVGYLSTTYQLTDYKLWDDKEDSEKKKSLDIQELITTIESLTQQNIQKNSDLANSRNASWREIDKSVGTKDEKGELYKSIELKTDEIIAMRRDIAALEKQFKDIVEQGERDVLILQEGIKEFNNRIINETRKSEIELDKLTKEKKELGDKLDKLQQRLEMASEGLEIDGEIILADITNDYVYIDLGHQDAIIKGMDFDVFSILKGGIKKEKGKVKIIKIFDNYSQAAIIPGTIKSDNVITINDFVNSDIYNRQKTKTFLFAGNTVGKYLLEEIKKKIEEFGGKVLSEVTSDVVYVVVGKDFENDANYKKAIQLGAVVLREKELYNLLNINWKD
ncbi:MAG: BRCT domain-containing protein [Planctomycetota bacterium]